jgi:CheY-like chemotaxis protein
MNNKNGARWMLVDDDTDVLDTITLLLTAVSGAEISGYASPWQALDALATEPNGFDLVITDLEMPGMNGIDFRRHVHAISPSTKILLATGSGLFTDESAREYGFCGLLTKPFSLCALKRTLANVSAELSRLSMII